MPAVLGPNLGPIQQVIIQPTPFCNIDCSYCYLPDRANSRRMTVGVMQRVLEFVIGSESVADQLHIVWHAGEPLTVPKDFYEHAFEQGEALAAARKKAVRITHSIQTNGTLIDESWCDLFRRHRVQIGLSLDGPAEIHDARRRTRSGRGTHTRVMDALGLLMKNAIPTSVITVLSRAALQAPDLLFEFYQANSIRRVGFNVDEVTGQHESSLLMRDDSEELFRQFVKRMWYLVDGSTPRLRVREFDRYTRKILTEREPELSQLCEPFTVVNIDYRGRFSTFCPELLSCQHVRYPKGFTIGDVSRDTMEAALTCPDFIRMCSEVSAGVQKCRSSCDYFRLCGGGAPSNKLFENGTFDSAETNFCKFTRKIFVDVTLEALEAKLYVPQPLHMTRLG